jgi:intein-encoded DNA endonuclease-like protein
MILQCNGCNRQLNTDLNLFSLNKTSKTGFQHQCKECIKKFNDTYNGKNKVLRGIKIAERKEKLEKDILKYWGTENYIQNVVDVFNIGFYSVKSLVKKFNLKIVDTKRKYYFDEDFFEEINTESKAYFLGVFFGDGNVSYETNTIALGLQDKDVIEKFCAAIQYEGQIETHIQKTNKKEFFRVRLHSLKLKNDLMKHGCVPRKSLVLKYPQIHSELEKHFLRGALDSDGCVCCTEKTNHIYFLGTYDFLEGVQNYFKKFNIKNSINKIKSIFRYYISAKKSIILVLKELYDNAQYYMDRKYNKANSMLLKLGGL